MRNKSTKEAVRDLQRNLDEIKRLMELMTHTAEVIQKTVSCGKEVKKVGRYNAVSKRI